MLRVNNLVGFGVGGVKVPTLTYRTFVGLTANTGSYSGGSLVGLSVGAADSTRIAIGVVYWDAASGTTLSSCTIGGVSATVRVQHAGFFGIAIVTAAVPTGTTADVAFVLSDSAVRAGFGLWTAINLNSETPTDSLQSPTSGNGSNTARNVSVTIDADGFGIFVASSNGDASVIYTNADERYDNYTESSLNMSGADRTTAGAVTVSIDAANLLMGAAFR